jgi:hypothetical protein
MMREIDDEDRKSERRANMQKNFLDKKNYPDSISKDLKKEVKKKKQEIQNDSSQQEIDYWKDYYR